MSQRTTPILLSYIPHGMNHKIFRPITEGDEEYATLKEFKKQLFREKEYNFVLFFNSRNIRRKQIPDTLLAYKYFIDSLPEEEAIKCAFLLHTQICDDNGTDLNAVCEFLFGENKKYNIIFSEKPLPPQQMNYLYNSSDAQILLTSNEGWGLSLTEAILVGNPIIANVTGGMQDQMRFVNENNEWFTPDSIIPSNNTGRYRNCGKWAFPVFPSSRSIQGSPTTPYIWDDRCKSEDAAFQINQLYSMSKDERKERGMKGREWALSDEAGFTGEKMGEKIINCIDKLFENWKPREKFSLINTSTYNPNKQLNHELIY
jgi:hypothetical protein